MEPTACPHCAAVNPPGALTCWLCRQAVQTPAAATARMPEATPSAVAAHRTFGLSSLMLVIALIAVFLGVLREAPGLAIGLAVVSTPVLIRAARGTKRREAQRRPMTFLASLGVVLTAGVGDVVAFFVTCLAEATVGWSLIEGIPFVRRVGGEYAGLAWSVWLGLPVAVVVAGFVGYVLIRRLWTRNS